MARAVNRLVARHPAAASRSACGAISTWTARRPPRCWSRPCARWARRSATTSRCARRESHGVNLPTLKQVIAGGAQADPHLRHRHHRPRGRRLCPQARGSTCHHRPPRSAAQPCPRPRRSSTPSCCPQTIRWPTLPGVGVAYKLAEALYDGRGGPGRCGAPPRPGRPGHRGRRGPPARRHALPAPARAGRAAQHRSARAWPC